jgi:hypothetical protein
MADSVNVSAKGCVVVMGSLDSVHALVPFDCRELALNRLLCRIMPIALQSVVNV